MSLLVHVTKGAGKEYDGREVYMTAALKTSRRSLFVLELDGDVMSLFVDFKREKQTMRELVTSILASVPLALFVE